MKVEQHEVELVVKKNEKRFILNEDEALALAVLIGPMSDTEMKNSFGDSCRYPYAAKKLGNADDICLIFRKIYHVIDQNLPN